MLSDRVGGKQYFIRKSCKKCMECFIMVNIYHTGFLDQTFSELHNNQFSGFVRPELWGYDIIVIVLQMCMVAEILHDIRFKKDDRWPLWNENKAFRVILELYNNRAM